MHRKLRNKTFFLGLIFILLFMASTSTKNLFRKFNKYHKFLYLVLLLTTIHFIMAQKSLSLLQYGYLVVILAIFIGKIGKRYKVRFLYM